MRVHSIHPCKRVPWMDQVVVPQCEAAACNLRTRCRLTNLNTPFESILREDSRFGIRSRRFGRAVPVFQIRCNQPSSAAPAERLMAVQLKPALAALAWPRRWWRLLCAHGHCPATCPLWHRLGPCSRRCLARLGLRASEHRLGCERRAHGACSESHQPAGDLRPRSGGLSRRSAL